LRRNKRTRRNVWVFIALVFVLLLGIFAAAYKVRRVGPAEEFNYTKPASWKFYDRLANFQKETAAGLTPKPEDRDLGEALANVNRFSEIFKQVHQLRNTNGVILAQMGRAIRWENQQLLELKWDEFVEFCTSNQDLLQSIRNAAAQGGPAWISNFPIDNNGQWIGYRFGSELGVVEMWLAADARVNMRIGNSYTAFADLETLMSLGNILLKEPNQISQSHGRDIYSAAVGTITDAFPSGTLSSEQTQRLVALCGEAYRPEIYVDALITEGLSQQVLFSYNNWMYRTPQPVREALGPIVNAQELNLSAWAMNRVIEAARRPYPEGKLQIQAVQAELGQKPDFYFSVIRSHAKSMLYYNIAHFIARNVCNKALFDVTRLGLLVEDYHWQNGDYPESLDVFAPEFGGTIPVDPMTEKAYVYKSDTESFLLYSVGLNGKDDGGKGGRTSEDDLVWRRWMRKSEE